MMKTATRMMFLAIGLVTALSTASAISLPDFRSACTANGGVLGGGPGSGTTCTFVETETVPGSHPVFVWEVDADQEIVRTWRNASASGVGETVGEKLVTGCRNHQGNSIGDFEDNPNCQPQ